MNIEIKGVVKGYNPGWIFVDNIEKPKTALIWSKAIEGFYFIGKENNIGFNSSINEYIDIEITPRAKSLGLDLFEFSGTSKEWDITINELSKHRSLNKSKQITYKNENIQNSLIKDNKLEKDFKLVKVDKNLFKSNIFNLNFLKNMILDWCVSEEYFLKEGVGFCILHNKRIVSCCISSCVTKNEIGSHTVTLKQYRNKGLAKGVINEFLRYCKANGFEPNWDCMEKNSGSRALAESCGYTKAFDYFLYDFKL
ncbi:GNAT family N-acetyltransferase [Dethiothermospora halolimnae]|uniref:GNAT family N-acetyltransferase n=1 Tax=Dethiothermospora halolimnae TaxID=3114390 RepID=UPI003CCC046F